jgi:hypothetical protein
MINPGAMIMRTIIAVWVASILFASLAFADEVVVDSVEDAEARFVPAQFAKGLDAAAAEIKFPKYKEDLSLNINCGATVSAAGKVETYFCLDYLGGGDNKFRRAAEKFIRSTSLTPALVDGVAVPVHFYFRVFFGRQGELYAVGVFPNWADDADKYGQEYQAPQRYNEDASGPNCFSVGGISKIAVGSDGAAASNVDLVMSYGVPEHYGTCESLFVQRVAEGSYIPAHHEGKPVTATYVELGGDPEWFTLRPPEGL